MSLTITTTGTVSPVVVSGRELIHPVADFDILTEFEMAEVDKDELQSLMTAGQITVKFNNQALTDTEVIEQDIPLFTGSAGSAGTVPADGQTPSGRVFTDYGYFININNKWKDYGNNDGPEFPNTAFVDVLTKEFNVPNTANYKYSVKLLWSLDSTALSAEFKLLNGAQELFSVRKEPKVKTDYWSLNVEYIITGLTAGLHTFKLQAKRSGGNKDFEVKNILIELEEM